MDGAEAGRRVMRKRRSVAEKRRIVELTLEPGASVARVSQAEGVNANQVFAWRRALGRGELVERGSELAGLLLVAVTAETDAGQRSSPATGAAGSIHIELQGRALLSIECGADPVLVRVILESLCK
jgi:transposase